MNFGRIILWVVFAYFIYKFIFDFLLPLLTVSRRMKQQVRDFQQHAQEQQEPIQQQPTNGKANPTQPPKAGEYIDFEEVKSN